MKATLVSLDYQVPNCNMVVDQVPLLIGSGPEAQVSLEDPSVSPSHCLIERMDGRLMVYDLGSVHGTFVNGRRITQSPLNPGDVLSVGMRSFFLQQVAKPTAGKVGGKIMSGAREGQTEAQLVGST